VEMRGKGQFGPNGSRRKAEREGRDERESW
jgi:hypothetical protein